MSIKAVIVFRKDLNCRKGKIASQVAHASLKVFLDRIKVLPYMFPEGNDKRQMAELSFTPAMLEWLNWEEGQPGFTKIVVGCNSESELKELEAKANAAGIPNAIILDNGVTEFHGVKTYTCICIGPDESEKIDLITGDCSLL
jgi:PTH2 family peptidyl-tRNA hydrolase